MNKQIVYIKMESEINGKITHFEIDRSLLRFENEVIMHEFFVKYLQDIGIFNEENKEKRLFLRHCECDGIKRNTGEYDTDIVDKVRSYRNRSN